MRRMLDPTTLGGGSTTTIHVYSVRIDDLCHYEVYTTKDYGFTIGSVQTIIDFKTNDNYKELRTEGQHPAAGYIEISPGGHKRIVGSIEIGSSWFVKGYDLTQGEPRTYITESTNFTIVKLY